MKTEKANVADLMLDPSNVRKHSAENLNAIKASLAKFGQQKPIVADKKGVVVAGNGQLMAAKALANHSARSVIDLFAGSGSTLMAAETLKRRCFAMEMSPHYCDVIVRRWETFSGKKAVRG